MFVASRIDRDLDRRRAVGRLLRALLGGLLPLAALATRRTSAQRRRARGPEHSVGLRDVIRLVRLPHTLRHSAALQFGYHYLHHDIFLAALCDGFLPTFARHHRTTAQRWRSRLHLQPAQETVQTSEQKDHGSCGERETSSSQIALL